METSANKRRKIIVRWSFFVVLLAALIYAVVYINSLLPIVTGYPAKYLCSAVFLSNRDQREVEALDLNFSFIKYVTNKVDQKDSSVTSSFLWGKSKAIFRKGFGSTLLRGTDETTLRRIKFPNIVATYSPDIVAWPLGNLMPDTLINDDTLKLARITQKLMQEKGYNGNAFAFMVVHKGIPIVEAYQPQFNSKTRFQSWSMAKSITNALVGLMVKEDKMQLMQPVNLPQWQNDDRKHIKLNDLMQMQSGLKWNEDYGNRSDVTLMLYNEPDFARYTYSRPLEFPVGSKWLYSSGSTNIISYLIRKAINNDADYYAFAKSRLFDKIGMTSALFEVDASGTQVGSSYLYATARDYARFGLLYLQDGMFNGGRILPEGWVKYTTTPGSGNKGEYGALFWLNKSKYFPSAPEDMFSCNGHEGQHIFIIPSKELVIVVLGYSPKPDRIMDFDSLLGDILKAVK
ncbi:MAG: serine hydrolase domain-containing protein [Methylococcaceae bacterium]|nr:serine hydrolase [Prolixibacteraceae bacterium]